MGHDSAPTAPANELGPLRDEYQIIGELRGSTHTRDFLATRRESGRDVIITVCRPSPETNTELSHFAADAKLLAGARHPHVLPVVDVRWIDGNALVVVRERAEGTSLADALERGETMANPRIAVVLQEVFSALEWARERGVVHREITTDNLFIEDGSQRVLVAFTPSPIPMTGVPDQSGDACTIGMLAWAMLTGQEYDPAARRSLAAVAPNLASRVVDAVERLLNQKRGEPVADIPASLGIIAAGDVLKQAEVEISAMKEEYQEQHRAELAKCEAHRLEIEQQAAEAANALADERAEWVRQVAAKENELAEAHLDFDRVMTERQEQLAAVRAELEAQADALELRLAEFDERRAAFEQEEFERQRADAEAAAAAALPEVLDPGRKRVRGKKARKTAKPAKPVKRQDREQKPRELRNVFAPLDAPPRGKREEKKRRWWIPAGIGLLAAAVAMSVVFARYGDNGTRIGSTLKIGDHTITTTAPSIDTRLPSRGGFLRQDAGTVDPKAFGAGPQPAVRPDSAQTAVDSAVPETAKVEERAQPKRADDADRTDRTTYQVPPSPRRPEPAKREPEVPRETVVPAEPLVPRDSSTSVDTTSRPLVEPRRDSTPSHHDTVGRPGPVTRPGSVIRVDTVYKRGEPIRVDPDTMRIRPH